MAEIGTQASSYGLDVGAPEVRSVGPIVFGPGGILFVADNASAAIFALDVVDITAQAGGVPAVEDLDLRLAAFLGCRVEEVHVRDMAAHPVSREVYLSVMRGSGAEAVPVLIRVAVDGSLGEVSLDEIAFDRTTIADAPADDDERVEIRVSPAGEPYEEEMEIGDVTLLLVRDPLRTTTVTDLAYVDGCLLVAGASNEEFTSTLRRIPFPFGGGVQATSLEIFHVSHGKYETHSPIRTFVASDGGSSIVASYTCTPVVHFSIDALEGQGRATGRTVAELGAMNTPLDMIAYDRDGEEYLLVSNSRHPLIRIASRDIDTQEGLTNPTEPVGIPRDELSHEGVRQMAAVDGHVLMIQRDEPGRLHLRAYDVASL